MTFEKPTIFLSAAEASGDEHAARLIRSLRKRLPGARFVGAAGKKMAAEGCEVLVDLTETADMLGGPFLKIGYWIRTVKKLQREIKAIRPDIYVPVDSPALNWHLAKAAKAAGSTVVYFIAPQVWAWATWRVKKLARLTDHVACILPFEQEYLRQRGVNATYVGHPLLEQLPERPANQPDILEAWANGNWQIAMLPGSRPGEIHYHAPALLEVQKKIHNRWPEAKCIFTMRNQQSADLLQKACGQNNLEIAVGRTHEVLAGSHFAVAASGTVTLEVAYFGVPMVIFYRVNRFGYPLIWPMIQTPHLSLVNILAGRQLVPELMPWYGNKRIVTDMVMEVMEDPGGMLDARQALLEMVGTLETSQKGSAADNAADIVIAELEKRCGV